MPEEPTTTRQPSSGRHAELIAEARRQFEGLSSSSSSTWPVSDASPQPVAGLGLDKYEIINELSRGGQGIVYVAWQKSTRRKVAVKLMRAGPFAVPSERVRFQREVQILASLKHPNIVTVHDSGESSGCFYFVMDFVDGPTLDAYVRQSSTPVGSRAEIKRSQRKMLLFFAKVCDAVQAAHLHGVIHRDLKPSNVRVDAQGEPRVLDFGLAKTTATPDGSSEAAPLTETGQFVGTLAYASPEQAEGVVTALDVRTDVYSLGVMLYEMLTGRLPYPVTGPLPDVLDNIRHIEPKRPSVVAPNLRGDLEIVLLKSLSKQKERRYQTAGEMAADLRCYVQGDPIEAKRDSSVYLLRMFMRRHRIAALVTMAFVALLACSSVTLAYLYANQTRLRMAAEENLQRAVEAEALAIQRADEKAQIAEFQASQFTGIDLPLMGMRLRRDLLDRSRQMALAREEDEDAADRFVAELEAGLAGVNFTDIALQGLEENIFGRTHQAIDDQFTNQPLVRAGLLQSLGQTLAEIGLLEQALGPQAQALEILRQTLGAEERATLTSMCEVGRLLTRMGRFDDAMLHSEEALKTCRRVFGDEDPLTLNAISIKGVLLQEMEHLVEAMALHNEALETGRHVLGKEHPDTLASLINLAGLRSQMGHSKEALGEYREALEISRRIQGDDHPTTLTLINNVGYILKRMSLFKEAKDYFAEAIKARRRVFGDQHPSTLNSIDSMGGLYHRMGETKQAMRYFSEALSGYRNTLGDEHPSTLRTINGMAGLLRSMGRMDEAMHHQREALEGQRRVLGNDHGDTLRSMTNMGSLLQAMGRPSDALSHFEDALDTFRRVLGDDHPDTLTTMTNVGNVLREMGRLDEAMPYLREALDRRRQALGDEDLLTLQALESMASLLKSLGRFEEAEGYYRQVLQGRRKALPQDHPNTLATINSMGWLLQGMGRLEEALPYRREALAGYRRVLGDEHRFTLIVLNGTAGLLHSMGRLDESMVLQLEAVETCRRVLGNAHAETLRSMAFMGSLLQSMGSLDEAEKLLLEAAAGMASLPPKHKVRTDIVGNMVTLFEALHDKDPDSNYDARAERWRAELQLE